MTSACTSRGFPNQDEAIEFVRAQFLSTNSTSSNLTVIASYQGRIFSFERLYIVDDETRKLIQEKLKTRKPEDIKWAMEHSRPNVAIITLKAISPIDEEEFKTLQSRISRQGIAINNIVPFNSGK